MAKKSVVFFCAICFLAGNAGASFFVIDPLIPLALTVLLSLGYLIFRRPWVLLIASLALGIFCWQQAVSQPRPPIPTYPLALSGEIVFVESKINRQLVTLLVGEGDLASYKILLYLDRYPEYRPGQTLAVKCRLERPTPIEDFRYDRYLALSQIYYLCYRPQTITLLPAQTWRYWLFQIKIFYSNSFNQSFPEPEATIARAMMLAERKELSQDLNTQFSRAGLSHVMAISGMNMTLLVGALQAVALALSWKRSFTLGLALTVLSLYIVIIGFQASAVRAAVMAGILLLSQVVHRQYDPWYVLIVVAAILTAINPLSLMYDIGWQLSFLALAGLIFWQQRFERWLGFLPVAFGCRSVAAASLAAQVFTWPLLVYYFQTFSTIFLLTNVLALPAVDIIMVFTLVAPFIWWLPVIGVVIKTGILFLLRWLLTVCTVGSSLPFAAVSVVRLAFFWYLLVYFSLIIITWYVTRKKTT